VVQELGFEVGSQSYMAPQAKFLLPDGAAALYNYEVRLRRLTMPLALRKRALRNCSMQGQLPGGAGRNASVDPYRRPALQG
jgi:hypothetical protein